MEKGEKLCGQEFERVERYEGPLKPSEKARTGNETLPVSLVAR